MKHLKLFFTLLAVLLTAASLSAQTDSDFRPLNWFIGAAGGMNVSNDGQRFVSRDNSHWGAGTAGDFYIGKYFNRTVGFRVGYQGFGASNLYTNYDKEPFHYFHGDLLFRAGQVFVPYLHAGYAKIASGSPAGGAGVMIPIPLGRRVSIVPDFKATALNGAAFAGGTKGLAANLSATLGLRVRLGKLDRRSEPKPYVDPYGPPVNPVQPDNDTQEQVPVDTTSNVTIVVDPSGHDGKCCEEPKYPETNVVLFDFRSSKLREDALPILDAWAGYLLTNPDAEIFIEGHTCDIGTDDANHDLSFARAAAVRDNLTARGINPMRISIRGFGKSKPAVPNDSEANRARNRRAVILPE